MSHFHEMWAALANAVHTMEEAPSAVGSADYAENR
jgi:hypothetical protein